jgi:hypothetical protein
MLFLAVGPPLTLNPLEAALKAHIETVIAGTFGFGFDAAIRVNPLFGEGSVVAGFVGPWCCERS